MEIDEEREEKVSIGKDSNKTLKYLIIRRLKGDTSLKQLFIRIKNELKRSYEIELSKKQTIGIKLENGQIIVN
jgi:hypothetical protein